MARASQPPPCQLGTGAPRGRSASTAGAAVREVRGLGVSRSRPGGVPSPTWSVSSWSRIASAVFRTRSPVACTTWTGSWPSTRAAQVETYGIVYPAVSMPCAAPIISATDSASTSRMPRCCRASSSSGSCITTCASSCASVLTCAAGSMFSRTATVRAS